MVNAERVNEKRRKLVEGVARGWMIGETPVLDREVGRARFGWPGLQGERSGQVGSGKTISGKRTLGGINTITFIRDAIEGNPIELNGFIWCMYAISCSQGYMFSLHRLFVSPISGVCFVDALQCLYVCVAGCHWVSLGSSLPVPFAQPYVALSIVTFDLVRAFAFRSALFPAVGEGSVSAAEERGPGSF